MITTILFALFAHTGNLAAQSRTVVFDSINNVAVAYANIFKAEDGNFKGVTSNENGVALVSFPFRRITVSHVSYVSKTLNWLPDTVFLTPKELSLNQVTIVNAEPLWARAMLEKFIANKETMYRPTARAFNYNYLTRNTSDSSGYWFENAGSVCVPANAEKNPFMIKPSTGYIHFKDTTAGCDFTNMKRMLYHDFVSELDKKFLKYHTFQVNDAFRSENKDVVQLYFKSKKYGLEDKGYITMDTTKCLILAVIRKTGLAFNIDNNTNGFTRSAFNMLTGWKYTK